MRLPSVSPIRVLSAAVIHATGSETASASASEMTAARISLPYCLRHLGAIHKYRHLLGEVLLASFFLQLFALVSPLFFQVVIDRSPTMRWGLRFFTVYGPWGRPDMSLFLFTKKIIAGEPIDVFNFGHHARDFTFTDDIVEGIVRIVDKVAAPNLAWTSECPDPGTSAAP